MFRRSLHVFVALALLGLLATVGFALGRFRGPAEALAEAQALYDRGEYALAVAALDLSERSPSLQRDQTKRLRLLQLRYQANSLLQNWARALRDVELLLAEPGRADQQLQLDHIRLLAQDGKGELALQHAREFLKNHPGHGRGLELAGEACQSTYQEEVRTAQQRLLADVGALVSPAAQRALLAYLYRPDGDPEVAQGLEILRRIYAAQSRLVAGWPALQQRFEGLRARVQQGLQWFQQSLEAGGAPVAAFSGLAMSLDQSQRVDDLLILCESYRRRFQHAYVIEAGVLAAWALVRSGCDAAAIAAAVRWLPAGSAAGLVAGGRAGQGAADLLLARTVAAWRLRDRPELERVLAETRVLSVGNAAFDLVHALANAWNQLLRQDRANAESTLRFATNLLLRRPVPLGQLDLLAEVVPARVELLRARGAAEHDIASLFSDWIKARPADARAHLEFARHHLGTGKLAAAFASVEQATALLPNDAEVLSMRLAVARELYRESNQDGQGLLAQCVARKALVPTEVPDPVCYILCAEAALQAKVAPIARESARAAIDRLPWAVLPRQLEARAELLSGRPAEASRLLLLLLAQASDDAATLALAVTAHRAAGLSPRELVATALREGAPSDELLCELLRMSLADAPGMAAPFAVPVAMRSEIGPELRVLAAHALARLLRTGEAGQLLLPLAADPVPSHLRPELAAAVAATLTATAGNVGDPALDVMAAHSIASFGLTDAVAAPALLRCARDLAATHPATAASLFAAGLGAAAPEHRTGADYALAGDLAMRLGRARAAEELWTAALAFPDGRSAAEPLARLCLAEGRSERALQVQRLATPPTDGALALRCGDRTRGERLVRQALAKDAGDVLAHAAAATLGVESLASDLAPTTEPQREALLELLSLLQAPELGGFAVPRARALTEQHPASSTAALLLARALRDAGQAAAAAPIHDGLWQQGLQAPTLWREVALAAGTAGYVLPPKLEDALGRATALGKVGGSPVTTAIATLRTADTIARVGNQPLADQLRAGMWQQFPDLTRPSLGDAAGIAARNRPLDAWWILDGIRPHLAGPERDVCIDRMGALAERLSKADPASQRTLLPIVQRLLKEEGPHGRLVHFALDAVPPAPGNEADAARARQLLTGHLQLAATGRDPSDSLPRTIDRLVEADGVEATVALLDQELRAHPAALPLWQWRARLLAQLQRAAEGIDDLRTVLAHGKAPADAVLFVGLAAATLTLRPADTALLAGLPQNLLDSPAGRYARGLAALREGRADAAVSLLDKLPATRDGMHLLALAEALLQSRAADALPRAQQALAALAADYASSSLARYAGSFARQLAPR